MIRLLLSLLVLGLIGCSTCPLDRAKEACEDHGGLVTTFEGVLIYCKDGTKMILGD